MWGRRAASLLVQAARASRSNSGSCNGSLTSLSLASTKSGASKAGEAQSFLRSAGQQRRHQHGGWYQDSRGYQRFQTWRRDPFAIILANGRVLAVIGGGAAIIWWRSQQEIPYTGRRRAILLSPASEEQLGEMTYRQVLKEAAAKGQLLPEGHPAQQRVERIGRAIAMAATDGTGGGFQEHMKGLKWQYTVINSPDVNAFVVPGGKVVVYSKMLQLCETDDELASVLAHETAHVLARHSGERLTQQGWIFLLQMLAYFTLGTALPDDLFSLAFSLPHSRKQETEADIIGMQLAARACFDPAAGMRVFKRLGELEKRMPGSQMPSLLRTHPLSEARIKAIEANLPQAQQWAERSGCNARRQAFFDIFTPLERRSVFGSTVAAAVDATKQQ